MSITLVTGATGFVGSHVARALVERGDDVRVTVRAASSTRALAGLDVDLVQADLLDRRALRRALRGVSRVFHVAGSTALRAAPDALWQANVTATRNVLEAALREGVERVVHTSSVAAVGPAEPGAAVDETRPFPVQPLDVPYVDTKRAAEVEALRMAARGLPVVIVNPTHVLGPGDHGRSSTEIVRRFLLRRIPAYVDGAINVVDVRDVARGHVLADEHGRAGERYLLGNRNYTWDRLFADLARLSGIEPPALKLPAPAALALARAAALLPGPPPVTAVEVRAAAQWWTARSTKARRDLGWTTLPHEDTVEVTVEWWVERLGDRLSGGARQPLALRAAGAAAGGANRLLRAVR